MRRKPARQGITILGYLALAVPLVAVGYFSENPRLRLHDDNKAAFLISFMHITEKEHLCNNEEKAEHRKRFAKLRPHMRKTDALCGSRNRVPLYVKMTLDGNLFIEKVVLPAGIRNDGATFLHKREIIDPGEHTVHIVMKDGREHDGKNHYEFEKTFYLPKQRSFVLDYDHKIMEFVINGSDSDNG
jgi:hypothetical protein